jgi:hypothetical protein
MYDKGKIIIGIIIGVVLLSFPFWLNMGKASPAPEPILSTKAKQAKECIESKTFMTSSHMQLLNNWRDLVVRENTRTYVAENGKKYNMSLSNTCLECHTNKSKFCDQCHNYLEVKPYCWDCHIVPKESN